MPTQLKRTAYYDKTLSQDLTNTEIVDSKKPYKLNSFDQRFRNYRREKLKAVVMVEKEVGDENNPKPFIVSGVGINLTDNTKPDYNQYVKDGVLKEQEVQTDLKKIYYNMMVAAAANGAKAFVCPLLSSGVYGGQHKKAMSQVSRNAFEEACKDFHANYQGKLKIHLETEDAINRVNMLALELNCDKAQIAIGVAGADNSGTGNLCPESKHKFDSNDHLPQEERMRYSLGGAFADLMNYNKIDNVTGINAIFEKNNAEKQLFTDKLSSLKNHIIQSDKINNLGMKDKLLEAVEQVINDTKIFFDNPKDEQYSKKISQNIGEIKGFLEIVDKKVAEKATFLSNLFEKIKNLFSGSNFENAKDTLKSIEEVSEETLRPTL